MDKIRVEDMDPDVCMGERADVDEPCEFLVPDDADTGHGVIDAARRVEMAVLRSITDPQEGACSACGCSLVNLGALDYVPPECPRIAAHGGERG